jgi:hypothetical protein
MTRRWWHILTGMLVSGWLAVAIVFAIVPPLHATPWLLVHLTLSAA